MKAVALCIGILLASSSSTSSAEHPSAPGFGEPARGCGHTAELVAAKRALAQGDRAGAVTHLQRAKALAAACERDAVDRAPESESRTPASALAKAPAGADGFPYWARSKDVSPRI
jgi:hypothetical protein